MSVTLSPIAPRYAVSDADDPFKKYWWAILMGIVFTAIWLLTPMLGEKSVGSSAIDTTKPKVEENVEQSLASDSGDGINLSMEGTGHKRKEDGVLGSSLYQAPPEETAPAAAATAGSAALGSSAGSASGGTLAGALKKVSESSGGWGEKAQKGFNLPKLAGGSLSGMGAASGGRAGSASGSSAFGSSNAKVGFAGTSGLSGSAEIDAAVNSKGVAALKAAAAQAQAAAGNRSNDGARSAMSLAFDGAKAGSAIGGGGAALSGGYAALDAAPMNLKAEDPKLNEKKLEPPPGADVGQSNMDDSELAKQIALQVAGGVLGAVIGGPMGAVVTNVIMQAIQRQMDQQEKIREMEEKQQLDRATRRMGGKPSGT
ncbi:MAG: hypothetical protein HYX59_15340 [Elusimicrobia bacterium]|nr:hypothetical protein [Elusimicrobiota bacterium]